MLIVKKFGGTSVANKERIYNVANRCIEEYKKGNDVVVVLSAMGKYTDELISMAQIGIRITDQEKQVLADCAAANDLTISQILRSLIRRFIKENENDTDTKRSRV